MIDGRTVNPGVLLSALVALACAPESVPVQQKTLGILGGVESSRENVLYLVSHGAATDRQCTSTLIAPNVVLTARHCISESVQGTYSCTSSGSIDLSRARTPADAGSMGATFPPDAIEIFLGMDPHGSKVAARGIQVFAPDTDSVCRNDIALVVLDEDLALPIASVRLNRGIVRGEDVTVVGFGINDVRRIQRQERSEMSVLEVGESSFSRPSGSALPRTFVIGKSACFGDSGGPAFSGETGAVVGVSSLSRGDCESLEVRNFYTEVAPYGALIEEALAAAGHEAVLEEVPDVPSASDGGGTGAVNGGAGGASDAEAPEDGPPTGGCSLQASGGVARGQLWFSLMTLAAAWVLRMRKARSS